MISRACVRCGGSAYLENGEYKCLQCGATLDHIPDSILDTVKEQRAVVGQGRRKGGPSIQTEDFGIQKL